MVDLTLHECSTRRKIPVRSLIQPIHIKLPQPPRNVCWLHLFWTILPLKKGDHVISSILPTELRAWVRPPAQSSQLPQLQHYPGAPPTGHPAECGIHTVTWQGISHHAALQVDLWWFRDSVLKLPSSKFAVLCCGAGCSTGRRPACAIFTRLTAGRTTAHGSLCPHPISLVRKVFSSVKI